VLAVISVEQCANTWAVKTPWFSASIETSKPPGGADACISAGGKAEWMVADVTSEDQVAGYAEKARELWGQASFFFNNAGIEGAEAPLLSYPLAAWDEVMAVNVRGVFLGIRVMAPLLHHADTPRIVNTASVAGMIATPMLAAYGASKHAVIGLTKTAAVELAPLGISVTASAPDQSRAR
jgi:NAD(P)-dependent dehydrogenase (short-subunit alcohol dehydrogenase family)